MESSLAARALIRLCEEELSYQSLVDLYNALRMDPSETSCESVAQHALAQIIGEIIDYLNIVGDEFEKTIGLTRQEERERILSALSLPDSEDLIQQVDNVIHQWRAIECYSHDDFSDIINESGSRNRLDR